ncbi:MULTISPECIES: acyltransferase [Dethiosulfovibrio]|uniref:N-acetyltransferase n=2 Tax=Dethiosulfovibrio TaxID=47054 RepID=A0ABS9ELX0_9BACT|nr:MULTISPECIES: acyltransferase [Dethiosulfovibrio]MCF4113135.1 N-acetyltransferase [Dethiosulfovibrio russensis]MCF4142199.1 N-acetyltransferase [Dethiosulfovibrio marinus]MCF4146134.1 N-acetyltransferase [Dethiosulfovibrio acidaminovorans]
MACLRIHDLSDVQSKDIGENTSIWQYVVVLPGAKIGSNCNINALVFIENDVIIGNNVTVKSGVQIWDGLRIAHNVFIGPNVTFSNDLFPRSKRRPSEFIKTNIEDHASIGANATIIAGVTIGAYSLIGAGSVVTKDVPPHGLVYGNPARIQGYVCNCGQRIGKGDTCPSCGFSL